MQLLTMRIPEELHAKAKKLAASRYTTLSEIIRQYLLAEIEKMESKEVPAAIEIEDEPELSHAERKAIWMAENSHRLLGKK